MECNFIGNVPRTYLGLKKIINSARGVSGWDELPEIENLELLIAFIYFRIDSWDEITHFESNDYLRDALDRAASMPTDFAAWLSGKSGHTSRRALITLCKRTSQAAPSWDKKYLVLRTPEGVVHALANKSQKIVHFAHQNHDEDNCEAHTVKGVQKSLSEFFASNKSILGLTDSEQMILEVFIANRIVEIGTYCQMLEFRLGQQRFFSEQDLALLEEQGFIVKKEFLPREDLATLRCITYEISRKQRDAKSAYFYGNENKAQRIYNLLEKSTEFSDLFISRPAIFEIVHRFFGTNGKHTPYFLSSFQANILGPGTKAQAIHVDNSVPDPLPPWKIRLNINLLLDAFTETNGATLVYPGSQKLLRKPTIKDDASGFMRKIIAPAGSLVVWTGHLWHQSGENISDTPRAALLSCFVASYLREVVAEENYLASINQGRMNELPFEIRTILGYYHGRKTSS